MEGSHMTYPYRMMDRLFLFLYSLLWTIGLPVVIVYLWKRSWKEPLYFSTLVERFGGGAAPISGAIWVHAVSLGELRAAQPLISALLVRGEKILISTMTAAGRKAALSTFAQDIDRGQVHLTWVPFDAPWVVRRFLRRHKPTCGMILEIELWPGLIAAAASCKVPLIMAQAQYPIRSFLRDKSWPALRRHLVRGFSLIMAKSFTHASRFQDCGAAPIEVMGELRFELPIPAAHLMAAKTLRQKIGERPVFCFASTHPDEDALLAPVLEGLQQSGLNPFFVYVPRHPAEFNATADKLATNGLKMLRRSEHLTRELSCALISLDSYDGLFGDSIGEINFYFKISEQIFMGDSFIDEGSHNIIEPLRLFKPVTVGPSIWGIEYPATEALAAGILTRVASPQDLLDHWLKIGRGEDLALERDRVVAFVAEHGGATDRALSLLTQYKFLNFTI
ncbi:MAG: 3-deoxy-D-manno-octulosonic-acid transferase [Paracoccaceae bacterium]|jgi:3-deoxy-D-manno-octulosonic-acid transferase